MFGDHGLCGLLEEGAHGKSPKCLDGNLGDFGEFCKGLRKVVASWRPCLRRSATT
ncbi:NAD(P)H-flavin oxidoreductase [Neisseria mucosa]|nr:NAD(P)H-flavin oxidoreductase [Neisseria mucosa]